MTILSAHDLVLPAASLGPENPLAPLRSHQELHQVQNLGELPEELRDSVEGPDGTPVLRLWELERTRNLVTQLDFWLPADSEFLYVGVRLQNPSDTEVPAYWWSNIAVEQSPETRVLVPADQAWRFGYAGAVRPRVGAGVDRPVARAEAVRLG